MIGRTQLATIENGAKGAAAHMIEVAEKALREAIAARAESTAVIRKCRATIARCKRQLREAKHGR